MQTLMQTSYTHTDHAAQVIAMASHRESRPELSPFNSNSDHLQALEQEAKLMVAATVYRNGRPGIEEAAEERGSFPFLPAGTDLPQITALLESTAAENRIRENLSLKKGIPLNFVEFCTAWDLDAMEQKIVLLLLMQFSSPSFYTAYENSKLERNCDNGMQIGVVLSIISGNLGEQLAHRRYFSIHASLLGKDLLTANHECIDNNTSILRMSVYLHERFVRHILGDDNHYHVAFRFIRQERPNVNLDQVVIPDEVKNDVVRQAEQFLAGRRNGTLSQLDDFYGYGTGLTFLFHGPSGTGKTMLAKGLANHLSCPLVSLNLEDMSKINISDDEILAMLFREAALLDGIVFLDECDDTFNSRNGPRLSRSLLLEIEKSRCITILATNRPLDLDPAMERRITMKILFDLPGAELRLRLWQALLPPTAILNQDVDLKGLAEHFDFTGGLIKNSILMGMIASAVPGEQSVTLTHAALEHAASHQTETVSDVRRLCENLTPVTSLEAVPVGHTQREQLRGLAKAWQWLQQEEMGLNLLFTCSDITTGITAACGLAAEAKLQIHAFDFTVISSLADDNKILDMVSQRRIYPMTAAFQNRASSRAMILFIDYQGEVARSIDAGVEKAASIMTMYSEMLSQLRKNKGLFCLVTKEIKAGNVPVEFHQMLTLLHPPEELQMRQWEERLGWTALGDDALVELVERYPMHIPEIEFIARQAKVRAIMSGRSIPVPEDVIQVISSYRGARGRAVLFGGKA